MSHEIGSCEFEAQAASRFRFFLSSGYRPSYVGILPIRRTP
jgi:hypothetical protein